MRRKFRTPRLFDGDSAPATEGDYFVGIGCVFLTYLGFIHDEVWPKAGVMDCLEDFRHRLTIMMHTRDEAEWSAAAILGEPGWEKLRKDARTALSALGLTRSEAAPMFDLVNLIDVTEFRTSDEVRKLLE